MNKHKNFKSGFINIIGLPNVGKSTLLNAMIGAPIAITSPKVQTTRKRILGIMTEENFQFVFSDTPGAINPAYQLQERMMHEVKNAIEDADVLLLMVSLEDKYFNEKIFEKAINSNTPTLLLINKMDKKKGSQLKDKQTYWQSKYPDLTIIPISALEKKNIDTLITHLKTLIPEHPPYFAEDTLTDKSERFICAEMIREKIFLNYHQEIPYSTEVVVTEFKTKNNELYIEAKIFVEKESQKGIIIGKKAEAIKKVGILARKDMENFFQKKIHLKTLVKVEKDWKKDGKKLKRFGY